MHAVPSEFDAQMVSRRRTNNLPEDLSRGYRNSESYQVNQVAFDVLRRPGMFSQVLEVVKELKVLVNHIEDHRNVQDSSKAAGHGSALAMFARWNSSNPVASGGFADAIALAINGMSGVGFVTSYAAATGRDDIRKILESRSLRPLVDTREGRNLACPATFNQAARLISAAERRTGEPSGFKHLPIDTDDLARFIDYRETDLALNEARVEAAKAIHQLRIDGVVEAFVKQAATAASDFSRALGIDINPPTFEEVQEDAVLAMLCRQEIRDVGKARFGAAWPTDNPVLAQALKR